LPLSSVDAGVLSPQPPALSHYEVVVVDDGSTDATAETVRGTTFGYPVPLRYFSQPNRRQGAARNLGARQARGRYLLFLGDDTVPAPHFLAQHAASHAGAERQLVVIGYTPWGQDLPRTRFMEYIGERGWQFGFSLIQNPDNVPFNFFYTSNLSLSRSFFLEAGGFDEDFREYGWEDVELSLRLKGRGMRLVYNPQAVAYHHHPTSIASFAARQRKVGFSAWTFYRKHPDMADFLNVERVPDYTLLQRLKMELLTQLCRLTEKFSRPDLSSYYPDLMSYHYNLGIVDAREGK
ncbi:MAG: glycosyltransferase family 2 protein, partial [Acidobacteriota bacterium]